MSEDFLIVDGHSMIFAWEDLRALHVRNREFAREELIRRLLVIHDSGRRVAVVFDGRGEKNSEELHPTGVKVFYSRTGRTADDIVERLTARLAGKHDVLVATSDRLEQQTVSAFGGRFIDADGLRREIDTARRSVEEAVAKRRKNLNK